MEESTYKMSDYIEQIKQAVVYAKHKDIEELVKRAIDEKTDLDMIVNNALISAMDIVGMKFSDNEIFVPEMLASAVTMKKALGIIKPLLTRKDAKSRGTIMIGTVKGDLHDIGKNLVIMMLEGAGFRIIDLGVDLSAERAVAAVAEFKPDILGLSALLTTTLPAMEEVIKILKTKGLRDSVKVMVGGAPVDLKFAQKIGADGYGKDAAEAVQLAKTLLSRN
jgi:5-methyltetrahydrofolate--homocysteine methyltransferase